MLRTINRNASERGITGLETAIILIAFVVVASVFAFTVLSTGIFASERSKETVSPDSKKPKAQSNHVVRLLPTRAKRTSRQYQPSATASQSPVRQIAFVAVPILGTLTNTSI